MIHFSRLPLSALIFLSLSDTAPAAVKGSVEFIAKATPGFLTIEGEKAQLNGDRAQIAAGSVSGVFSIPVKDLKTGIKKRDEHLAGYLDAEKFPIIEFTLKPVLIAGGTKKAFSGELTMHGVSRPVNGIVEFSSTKAVATFSVIVTDYGVKTPTYELLTVAKNVDVSVEIQL